MNCFIDESVHRNLGFAASAFVFSSSDLDVHIAEVLQRRGLDPRRDEFKSGARMVGNAPLQEIRADLFDLIRRHTHLAVVFGPTDRGGRLGRHCLQALQSVLVRNGISPVDLNVFFDNGIFPSQAEARALWSLYSFLAPADFHPAEDSRVCRGIQAADLAAHTFAQVLRDELLPEPRRVAFDPDFPGEPPGSLRLSMLLLGNIRRAVLSRRIVVGGEHYDPATDPVVFGPDDDFTVYGAEPEVFGWGVQVATEASEDLRRAVRNSLDRIWLGCMH